jgi:hypothetical protein
MSVGDGGERREVGGLRIVVSGRRGCIEGCGERRIQVSAACTECSSEDPSLCTTSRVFT